MDINLSILWKSYKQNEDVYYRDRLINSYRPFIKKIINHIYSRLPKTVDINDIEGYANIGLIDAIRKFDMDRNLKFETYASYRIKGAIIDGIRHQDWLSRSLRSGYKNIYDGDECLQKNCDGCLNGQKDEEEDFQAEKKEQRNTGERFYMFSIDDPDFYNRKADENSGYVKNIYDIYCTNNTDFAEKLETRIFLRQLLMKLSHQERKIVFMYYFKGKNFREIGRMLNITESRVSQINKQILAFFRKEIRKAS